MAETLSFVYRAPQNTATAEKRCEKGKEAARCPNRCALRHKKSFCFWCPERCALGQLARDPMTLQPRHKPRKTHRDPEEREATHEDPLRFGKDVEETQEQARETKKRHRTGQFARHERILKRIHLDKNHSPGSLALAGHDLWRPLPFERRRHKKRKMEDLGAETLLCDIPAILAAGSGHGGKDVFRKMHLSTCGESRGW